MTEGQDASAAPAPWSGASRLPAAPDRGYAGAGQTGAGSVLPGSGLPGSGLPGSGLTEAALADPHRPAGGYAAAPVPAAATSTPQQGPVSLKHGGTGWPGSEPGQSVTSPAGAGQSPSGQTAPADGESAVSAPTSASAGLEATQSGGIWAARAEPVRAARSPSVAGTSQGGQPVAHDDSDEPFARVDARKLEAALLGLRHPIVTVPLLFEAPGVAEARAERVKLLSQIDDYLLPRLRQSGAPILVALVGSTGAGKSTLMNSLVGKQVSATGIRRPTTNSPVLACHPDDVRWFAENVFLPTMPRVRQQGLAMPGRDGLLVLAASEGMPKGVALLDTPDIDSVVQAHRDFAHQFLDASDLWLFVTTARRYADAAVWDMLKDARDRGAALALSLSRVPPSSSAELAAHFDAMLEANGLREVRRFIIPETIITDDQLPAEVAAPIRDWLADTARREDRRVAVLTQTMSGVLDTFRSRVPALADQVDEQLELRQGLRDVVDGVYAASLADFDNASRDGSLLRGEVQARWQDFAGTGDLLRTLQVRRGRGSGKQKRQRMPARAKALKEALRTSVESLISATADRAADVVVTEWRQQPAGARLLADIDAASGHGAAASEADFVTSALADLGVATGVVAGGSRLDSVALARATAGLTPLAERVVASWQEHVVHLVKEENVTKRSVARVVSFDDESLALVLSLGALDLAAPDARADDGTTAVPRQLLASLLGAGLLRDLGARVRQDLHDRVSGLLEAETRRYFAIIDAAGMPTESAAAELLKAGYALEDAR
jgi:GTPase SAR1 family protein